MSQTVTVMVEAAERERSTMVSWKRKVQYDRNNTTAEEPAAEEANEATPNSDAGDDAAAVTGESAQEPAEGSADEAEKAE